MKFKPNHKRWATLPVIVLLFFFLIFSSCKKDEPVGTNAGNGSITMKVDGVDWISKDAVDGAVILDSQGSLQILGIADDESQISFGLVTPTQGTTWDFSSGGSVSYKLSLTDTGWIGAGGIGDFSITFSTYNNNKAKGTFSGTLVKFDTTGTQEIVISDGSFDLNF